MPEETTRSLPPATERTTEQRLKMTYDAFLKGSDDAMHAEWVDSKVIVFTPPVERR